VVKATAELLSDLGFTMRRRRGKLGGDLIGQRHGPVLNWVVAGWAFATAAEEKLERA
jgi:hypothetical protein